ncbi:MAG TPA: hypothetical protein VL426_03220 [Candidatus Binatia bacterium]|jgi:hypothetical protein|nr:hypothetical protein [Candidatus Binatia bacterium]
MKKFIMLSAALLLIGAGCGDTSSSNPSPSPEPPEASAPPPSPPAKEGAADIRVTAIKAVTNPTGEITDAGCDGPQVDLVLTVQNFGADFPPEQGLAKWKAMIDARKGDFGAVSSDETPLFGVEANVQFEGKSSGSFETGTAPLLLKDLQGGKLKNGQMMDLKTRVAVPCCDQVGKFSVSAAIRNQSSLIPPGEKGVKEPYKDDFELHLADVTPGHGQFVRLGDGRMGAKVSVDNVGNAPTAGPVKVQVSLARKGSGFSAADWEMQIDQPFSGSAEVIAPTAATVTGEPDYSKVTIGVYPLCPSKAYDIIHDANPQNDHVERQASAP